MKDNPHELFVHAVTAWRGLRLLAYIDPGTGSYAYQLLIAGVTGVLFFFTSIKRKVLSIFSKPEPGPGIGNITPPKESLASQSKDQSAAS
jgi:hypothetical protein